uniref:Putative secreted protein n=1 Tax=Anopheles triannulatus TaxID=58253 RepID=A0A2M4B7G3_9DIPT
MAATTVGLVCLFFFASQIEATKGCDCLGKRHHLTKHERVRVCVCFSANFFVVNGFSGTNNGAAWRAGTIGCIHYRLINCDIISFCQRVRTCVCV